MASEVQLRRRIHELQSQIESLRLQKEIFEKKMSRQMEDRFVALKTEYERAFVRKKHETEELFVNFRNRLFGKLNNNTKH